MNKPKLDSDISEKLEKELTKGGVVSLSVISTKLNIQYHKVINYARAMKLTSINYYPDDAEIA